MTLDVQPVILCGGAGTRLWPLSRAEYPKQFLSLFGKESLFQLAIQRTRALATDTLNIIAPLVVGNEDHRFLLLDQLQEIGCDAASILLEPVARNTAPALTLAALEARVHGRDPVLVVSPADHLVVDVPEFVKTLREAVLEAAHGSITLMGIRPDRPETGFGYIRAGQSKGPKTIESFVEKPDRATAEQYLEDGGYYWNSGIFVLKASVWLRALAQLRPDILEAVTSAWQQRARDGTFVRPDASRFGVTQAESIDIAVMERASEHYAMKLLPLSAGWSDLGSWDAAWQSAKKDEAGNAYIGDAMMMDSSNVLVHATSRLVSVVGLQNVVVIETPDAVLVADRNRSQEVRKIVADLNAHARGEHAQHRKVYRPWGWYDRVDEGARFKVKRIMVKPGACLSLQKHARRAEHWVVVRGTAMVTCGDQVSILKENQSTFIPRGEKHRLANPTTEPLEIIEVQSGDYLGEDDIVRFDNPYEQTQPVDAMAKKRVAG